MSRLRSSEGFTLVELAIVLVIIGIILGAILKGQALIDNARIKRVENDMRGLEAALWTFFDRYNRFPGDCDRNGLIDASTYNNRGALDNNPDVLFCTTPTNNGDKDTPWAELKATRILSRGADNRDLARNAFGGTFYIGSAHNGHGAYVNAIAVADIPCFVAKAIDASIDGALDSGSGRIRVLTGANVFSDTSDSDNPWANYCSDNEDALVDIIYLFERQP